MYVKIDKRLGSKLTPKYRKEIFNGRKDQKLLINSNATNCLNEAVFCTSALNNLN